MTSSVQYKLALAAVIMLFVGIQVYLKPFNSTYSNQAEFILLCALPIVIMAQIPNVREYFFAELVVVILILLPVPLMAFFAYQTVKKEWDERLENGSDFELDPQDVQKRDRMSVASQSGIGDRMSITAPPRTQMEMTAYSTDNVGSLGTLTEDKSVNVGLDQGGAVVTNDKEVTNGKEETNGKEMQ